MTTRQHIAIDVPCAGYILCKACRGTAYELAKADEIQFMQVGRKKIVSVAWLEQKLGVDKGELDPAIDQWLRSNG